MLHTLIISVTLAITVSALCSVCEAVLYSITSSQVEMLKKSGHPAAEHLQNLRADIDEPITAILTLNTIANTIGASVAGAAAAKLLGEENLILFSASFTLAILLFSEILPKTVGVTFANILAPFIAYPVRFMVFTLKPIIWLCRFMTKLLPQKEGDTISSEELQTIALLSRESGHIEESEERVIRNMLDLKGKIVREVMTPRTVTFSLEESLTVQNAMQIPTESGSYSRIPIYLDEPDNITGVVMRKDILLAAAEHKEKITLSQFKKPAHFVPETAPLNRVLLDFFERHQHLFVVVDEYGTMTGIISMEDVLEEIVGREIVDETDKNQDMREYARTQLQEPQEPQQDAAPKEDKEKEQSEVQKNLGH